MRQNSILSIPQLFAHAPFDLGTVLAADGFLALQEGRPARMGRDLIALLHLLRLSQGEECWEEGIEKSFLQKKMFLAFKAWIMHSSNIDLAERQALLEQLNWLYPGFFSPAAKTRKLETLYLFRRAWIVRLLDHPWHSYTACFRQMWCDNLINLPGLEKSLRVPAAKELATEIVPALARRQRIAALLAAYDRQWREQLVLLGQSYPQTWRQTGGSLAPKPDPLISELYLGASSGRPQLLIAIPEAAWREASYNLMRAALALSLEDGATSASRVLNTDEVLPRESPWRDPFTDRPLRADHPTSPTLLYSVGLDMIDQGGAEKTDDLSLRLR